MVTAVTFTFQCVVKYGSVWCIAVSLDVCRRLLCFESSRSNVAAQKAVQAIFKALVPACGLFENGVIVSPLLSTGDQVGRAYYSL